MSVRGIVSYKCFVMFGTTEHMFGKIQARPGRRPLQIIYLFLPYF